MNNCLEKIGLIGWQKQEPLVLSALIADIPILFSGQHGQSKTKGACAIAKSFLGHKSVFQPYDYSRLSLAELLGFIDPTSLQKKEARYIPTPQSVWGADAILFDEFNRANVVLGSMAHELLTDKTVMGMKTNIKLAMAACNSPSQYETNFIDLATASRFVIINVPGPNDLNEDAIKRILLNNQSQNFSNPPEILNRIIGQCKSIAFKEESKIKLAQLVNALKEELNAFKGIVFSTRQTFYLFKMLNALECLKCTGYVSDEQTIAEIVKSLVPELSGLVSLQEEIPLEQVELAIKSRIIGFSLDDPIMGCGNFIEVLNSDHSDLLGWAGSLTMLAPKAKVEELREGMYFLKSMVKKLKNRPDIFNALFISMLTSYFNNGGKLPNGLGNKLVSNQSMKKLIKEI